MIKSSLPPILALGACIALAISYPILPYTFYEQTEKILDMPSLGHPFGTDELGRDIMSRVAYGLGVSLKVGILSAIFSTMIGVFLGMLAGYIGGWVDFTIMRFVDFMLSLPDIILVVLITMLIGRGPTQIALAIASVSWLTTSRAIRNETLRLRSTEFVESAKALGESTLSIMLKHILPNILGVSLTFLTLRIPSAILAESSLSFLGLGLKPPQSSLGVLCEEGFRALTLYPHIILIPAGFIVLVVWSLNSLVSR